MDINLLNSHMKEAANYKLDTLLQLFPQGDFKFLREKCIELAADDSAFEAFVNDALTTDVVPASFADPQENGLYAVTNFEVAEFIDKCPDPFVYFDALQRSDNHKTQMLEILKDRFRYVQTCYIENTLIQEGFSLLRAAKSLVDIPSQWSQVTPRQNSEVNLTFPWEPNLLKEVSLLDHCEEIEAYMRLVDEMKKTAIEEGQVLECECCYTSDILPCDAIFCTEAHIFCKDCIRRSTEVRIGDGLVTFPCLHDCPSGGTIPIKSLKAVVESKLYEKVVARIQEDEVKQANIPGIQYCQRCEYAAIPDENVIIFKCAKCDFELCRLCNKESHVPRKCGETVQEDIEKQHRKQHEEVQTSQVLRRCGGCRKPYVKISGCDKVTCVCGVTNCYKCGASGIDFDHIDHCRI